MFVSPFFKDMAKLIPASLEVAGHTPVIDGSLASGRGSCQQRQMNLITKIIVLITPGFWLLTPGFFVF